jgi:1-acyl-sn-glycerol-3-phosphate acyltransferase
VIIAGFRIIFLSRKKIDKNFHKISQWWARKILKLARVKIETIGKDNFNQNINYVFTANHSSMFDIPILQSVIDNPFRMIYKKELEKIFVFGYILKKSPYISIIRENSKNAMKGVQQAIDVIKTGTSVLLFPEGTRSEDGKLGEFKRGGFMLASRSAKPIVPVTIINSTNILPKGKLEFKGGNVKVIFNPPITIPENITKIQEADLMAQVKQIISDNIQKYS